MLRRLTRIKRFSPTFSKQSSRTTCLVAGHAAPGKR